MKAEAPSPWPLLLSRLRLSGKAVVTHQDLVSAGLDSEVLLRDRVIKRLGDARWHVPGCEHACNPNLDLATRRGERLVGVACPHEPSCWPGWQWLSASALEVFACPADRVFAALRDLNDLVALDIDLGATIVPVGRLVQRGRRVPVVWMLHPYPPFENICQGLRSRLEGDGLVVLLSRTAGWQVGATVPRDIVVLDVRQDADGDLGLWRALDILDPGYRERRVSDRSAIFDDVTMEFATIPGERHVVRINGHDFGGFRLSDLKFVRLLYLAAFRSSESNVEKGGWVPKWRLQGDEKDHDIEALRKEFAKHEHPELTSDELKALIKTSPDRDGRIRLAVHPRRLRFDGSLAHMQFVGEKQTKTEAGDRRRTPGAKTLEENLRQGHETARRLLNDARKLSVPAPSQLST